MRLSNEQRDLLTQLFAGLPGLMAVWNAAAEEPPRRETIEPDNYAHFTTVRRLPADMKPEDGSLRYAMPAPFEGAQMYSVKYFYEPAPPTGFPSLLVVVAWSCPAETVMGTQPTQPPGDA